MFPLRLLRDHRFGLLSAESQIVYGQIWKRADLRAPEGADLVGVLVSSCVALGPDPRRRAELALEELRKAGLLLELGDGALLPAHAPAARGIPAAGSLPELRPDQRGPKGGQPGWMRTRKSRLKAAAKKAAAAQAALPLDPPPPPPVTEPVTGSVTAPVSVTVAPPSPAVSGDGSGVAGAHPLSPPPGRLETARGREGDAPGDGAETRPSNSPGDGSRNGPRNGPPRSADELARLEPKALGRLFLDVLRARNLGKHFALTPPPTYELAALGDVIVGAQATEEELRAVAARWAYAPDEARQALSWDHRVRGGAQVKVSLLIGKHRNGQWQGKAFHDVLSDARAWMERVREAKAKAAGAPYQSELGLPVNPVEVTAGPPGAARAGESPARAAASGE